MASDYLMYVGIFDGLIFGLIGLKFLMSSLQKSAIKPGVIFAKAETETPIVPAKASKSSKPVTVADEIAEIAKKELKVDGLSSLIAETRKNAKTCSVCAAYTTFHDIGRFKQEGMTSSGVISHLDTKHKAQGSTDV